MFTAPRSSEIDHTSAAMAAAGAHDFETMARAPQLELALVTDRAAFDALENDWNALFEKSGRDTQVFQSFNWNWHWANHYLASAEGGIDGLNLSIVTARRNGELIMVWPLVAERVRAITQIFWMGEPVSQYGDVLIANTPDALDVMRAGWEFLKSKAKGDVVRLRRVRADARITPLLQEIGARVTNTDYAPYLDLASANTFADYENRYASRARRNRKRLARRLAEVGETKFERHCGGERARQLAVVALELKAQWLKSKGLVSHAIADTRMSAFFAAAAEGTTHSTNCIVAALTCNGEPAALEVSFTCKGRLAMHVIVYNLKYEKSGAGVLLLEQSLRDGYADKLAVYDMLAPGDAYKLEWADGKTEVTDWAQPLTLAGKTYARIYLGLVRGRMKAALSNMPDGLRRLITSGYALTF